MLVCIAPIANACDTSEAPCVTHVESGWSHHLEVSDRGVRVQVQTWGWVWDYDLGEWRWQAMVQETVSHDHSVQEDHSEYRTTTTWSGWDGWNGWNW